MMLIDLLLFFGIVILWMMTLTFAPLVAIWLIVPAVIVQGWLIVKNMEDERWR